MACDSHDKGLPDFPCGEVCFPQRLYKVGKRITATQVQTVQKSLTLL